MYVYQWHLWLPMPHLYIDQSYYPEWNILSEMETHINLLQDQPGIN